MLNENEIEIDRFPGTHIDVNAQAFIHKCFRRT